MAKSSEENKIELEKIELEKQRLKDARDLQVSEIALKERQLALTEELQKREAELNERQHSERSITAAQATVAGAVIALLSGLIGAVISSSSSETISETNAANALKIERTKVQGNLDLEASKQSSAANLARQEFETSLILQAIETEDREEAIRNLRFFVAAGFISDTDGKISALSDEQLPSQVSTSSNANFLTRMWKIDQIPVCWENPQSQDAILLELVEQTVNETWSEHSRLEFTGWGDCSNDFPGVRIRIDDVAPHTKALGRHLAGIQDGVVLNFSFERWSSQCANQIEYCVRTNAVHTFGHVLGFSHEHNRPDRPSECTAPAQGTNDDFFLSVTPYDPSSVMNYCNPNYANDGFLSDIDKQKLRLVYGDSPLPYCVQAGTC